MSEPNFAYLICTYPVYNDDTFTFKIVILYNHVKKIFIAYKILLTVAPYEEIIML